LLATFADAVAVFALPAAHETAKVLGSAESSGRPMSLADAQIAGICLSRGDELANRRRPVT
jgi:predicted nucleic acid-binding protein